MFKASSTNLVSRCESCNPCRDISYHKSKVYILTLERPGTSLSRDLVKLSACPRTAENDGFPQHPAPLTQNRYNANVKELQDTAGSEYFQFLSRKAHEGASNQVG